MSGQKNMLQMFLLSLSQERLLSTSEKNWESYYHLIEFIIQYDKRSMAEVPFAIDAKGGENVEQGR